MTMISKLELAGLILALGACVVEPAGYGPGPYAAPAPGYYGYGPSPAWDTGVAVDIGGGWGHGGYGRGGGWGRSGYHH